jgi:hypothetical protein
MFVKGLIGGSWLLPIILNREEIGFIRLMVV